VSKVRSGEQAGARGLGVFVHGNPGGAYATGEELEPALGNRTSSPSGASLGAAVISWACIPVPQFAFKSFYVRQPQVSREIEPLKQPPSVSEYERVDNDAKQINQNGQTRPGQEVLFRTSRCLCLAVL
jgi:hypothetical protein